MKDFELSIKSSPRGAYVTVKGSRKDNLINFALLAASISRNTGMPLDTLAIAVSRAGELYEDVVTQSVMIDRDTISVICVAMRSRLLCAYHI